MYGIDDSSVSITNELGDGIGIFLDLSLKLGRHLIYILTNSINDRKENNQ